MAKHNLLISSQRHCSNRETIKAKRTACEFDTQPWPNLTSPSTRSDATKTILQQQDSPGHWGAPKAGSAKESTNLQMQNHAKPFNTSEFANIYKWPKLGQLALLPLESSLSTVINFEHTCSLQQDPPGPIRPMCVQRSIVATGRDAKLNDEPVKAPRVTSYLFRLWTNKCCAWNLGCLWSIWSVDTKTSLVKVLGALKAQLSPFPGIDSVLPLKMHLW